MIVAAGLGTRLQPLTNDRPKAMVEVKGKPLLQWTIERLIEAGSHEIIVNVHHFADTIIDFIQSNNNFGVHIDISDERDQVLETGGGLKKAQWFFNDNNPFLVVNVDIMTNMNWAKFYESHVASGVLATLAVRRRSSSRYLLFNEKMHLHGWQNIKTGETRPGSLTTDDLQQFAFSGMQVLSPRIFEHMLQEDKFSIIEVYLRAMEKETIKGYAHDDDIWLDVGKPESLKTAEKMFFQ